MDLIDADHRYFAAVLSQIRSEEILRRDEKHLDLFVLDGRDDCLLCREALVGIDAGTGHEVWEFTELISHQSDERSDH